MLIRRRKQKGLESDQRERCLLLSTGWWGDRRKWRTHVHTGGGGEGFRKSEEQVILGRRNCRPERMKQRCGRWVREVPIGRIIWFPGGCYASAATRQVTPKPSGSKPRGLGCPPSLVQRLSWRGFPSGPSSRSGWSVPGGWALGLLSFWFHLMFYCVFCLFSSQLVQERRPHIEGSKIKDWAEDIRKCIDLEGGEVRVAACQEAALPWPGGRLWDGGPQWLSTSVSPSTAKKESLKWCQGPILKTCGQNATCRYFLFYPQYVIFLIKFGLQY